MRLTMNNKGDQSMELLATFDKWLLEIGNGNCQVVNKILGSSNKNLRNGNAKDMVHIPSDMLVKVGKN